MISPLATQEEATSGEHRLARGESAAAIITTVLDSQYHV